MAAPQTSFPELVLGNTSPIVVTQGSVTGLAEADLIATYDSESMAVGIIETPLKVDSARDLQHLLATSTHCRKSAPCPTFRIISPSPAFEPLLNPYRRGGLSRLTINIANACNLWCSYCYADHGTYHAAASLMSPDQAVHVASRALHLYARIRTVQFFGGEPLLNPGAIEAVCLFLEQELGGNCPEFVATTNGTVFSPELERILTSHHIGLTISIDGPSSIHDRLRPTNRGTGSHSLILANIARFRALDIPVDFECTYTSAHFGSGITVCDLLDYFSNELAEPTPHIGWSYLPQQALSVDSGQKQFGIFRKDIDQQCRQHLPVKLVASLFRTAAKTSMTNIARHSGAALDFVLGIVQRLASRQPSAAYCPAFTTQLSVAADGSVYPCFMFIGDPRFKMGNIFDSGFPGREAAGMWERYTNEFGPIVTGSSAWYAALLSGCIAGDYVSTGGLRDRLYEPVQEAMIQEVILGLARFLRSATKGENDYGS